MYKITTVVDVSQVLIFKFKVSFHFGPHKSLNPQTILNFLKTSYILPVQLYNPRSKFYIHSLITLIMSGTLYIFFFYYYFPLHFLRPCIGFMLPSTWKLNWFSWTQVALWPTPTRGDYKNSLKISLLLSSILINKHFKYSWTYPVALSILMSNYCFLSVWKRFPFLNSPPSLHSFSYRYFCCFVPTMKSLSTNIITHTDPKNTLQKKKKKLDVNFTYLKPVLIKSLNPADLHSRSVICCCGGLRQFSITLEMIFW